MSSCAYICQMEYRAKMLVMLGLLLGWNITTCMHEELVVSMSRAISPKMIMSVVNAEGISCCRC